MPDCFRGRPLICIYFEDTLTDMSDGNSNETDTGADPPEMGELAAIL